MRRTLPLAPAMSGIPALFVASPILSLSGVPREVEKGFIAAVQVQDVFQARYLVQVPIFCGSSLRTKGPSVVCTGLWRVSSDTTY
jgi:hypothetical protein